MATLNNPTISPLDELKSSMDALAAAKLRAEDARKAVEEYIKAAQDLLVQLKG